jgi:hypothetical protein
VPPLKPLSVRRTPGPFTIDHQHNIVDGAEQKQPHEAPEPPVDGLPGRKMHRQQRPRLSLVHIQG